MNRRDFLQLIGAATVLSAGGIALLEAQPREIIKTYFLPPRCGWNAGTWELACAQEALRIVNDKLGIRHDTIIEGGDGYLVTTVQPHQRAIIESLLARRSRLIKRCDKLARGWTPTRQVFKYIGDTRLIIHGGRSRGPKEFLDALETKRRLA